MASQDDQARSSRSDSVTQSSCSITDLLALRLQSVPFDFKTKELPRPTSNDLEIDRTQAGDHHHHRPSERLIPNRWVPQSITISHLGSLEPIIDHHPSSPSSNHLFRTQVPISLHVIPSQTGHPTIPLSLVLIPGLTLLQGHLPSPRDPRDPSGPSDDPSRLWLISGELCFISQELLIIAQSLYELGSEPDHHRSRIKIDEGMRMTNQVSFTGMISSVIPLQDRYNWSHDHQDHHLGGLDPSDTGMVMDRSTTTTIDGMIDQVQDSDRWYSADDYCDRQDDGLGGQESRSVSLADLEWIEISIEIGEKDSKPENLEAWVYGKSHLISVKCRRPTPAPLTIDSNRSHDRHDDHHRSVQYATPLPLVGQLIGIRSSHDPDDYQSTTLFVQL